LSSPLPGKAWQSTDGDAEGRDRTIWLLVG
jgi:hypothetical protein